MLYDDVVITDSDLECACAGVNCVWIARVTHRHEFKLPLNYLQIAVLGRYDY